MTTPDTIVTASASVITITNLTLGPSLSPFAAETWTMALSRPSAEGDDTLTLEVERVWLRQVMMVMMMMKMMMMMMTMMMMMMMTMIIRFPH
jgi:hypothetical protein